MVGLHVHRIECDELWAYVGHKRNPQHGRPVRPSPVLGDQYTYIALVSSTRAIVGYCTGRRDSATTDAFIQDLRGWVIGAPDISTDGLGHYKPAIRDAFGSRAVHGVVQKTYSVTHLNVNEASRRYSPAAAIAVEYDAVSGVPSQISTSYVERQNLTLRMGSKRFARLASPTARTIHPPIRSIPRDFFFALATSAKARSHLASAAHSPLAWVECVA
jgi:IS1 family transposase